MTLPANEKLQKTNLFEAILARRSVRAYAPDELDRNTVQTLLEAAVRAPTAMHEEPWAFVVVQNRQILKQLSDRAKPLFIERLHRSHPTGGHAIDTFANPDFNIFHGAGTLIVICAKPSGPFVEADCWLAAENLMLAACAIGLGSCVIGSCRCSAEPSGGESGTRHPGRIQRRGADHRGRAERRNRCHFKEGTLDSCLETMS